MICMTLCQGGTTWNVVAEEAVIEGTMRFFDTKVSDFLTKRINEIARAIAESERCTIDTEEPLVTPSGLPTINHAVQESYIKKVAKELLGEEWQKDLE